MTTPSNSPQGKRLAYPKTLNKTQDHILHKQYHDTRLSIPTHLPRRISRRRYRRCIPSPSPTTSPTITLIEPPLTSGMLLRLRTVLAHSLLLLLHRRTTAVPALPAARRLHLRRRTSDFPSATVPSAAAGAAAEEREEEEPSYRGADADDEGFVVVDPVFDLAAY